MKNINKYSIIWLVLGLVVFLSLRIWATAFASFGEAMIFWVIAVIAFYTFDRYVMTEIDTIEELKKGNISYALFLVAIAILFNGISVLVG